MYIPSSIGDIASDPLLKDKYLWMVVLGSVFIASVVDENIFIYMPYFEFFVDKISILVPSIKLWANRSIYPNSVSLLWSYHWLSVPFYAFITASNKLSEFNFLNHYQYSSKTNLYVKGVFVISLNFVFFYIFSSFSFPVDVNCKYDCIHDSIFLQELLGVCVSLGLGMTSASAYWLIKNFNKIYL
jgi:hypothetical protein